VTAPFIFICSAGHSGSTLLDILLGSHERGFSLGEITQLPKNIALDSRCSCGNTISQCEFWRPTLDHYGSKHGVDYWSQPYRLDLGFINASDEIDRSHQTPLRDLQRRLVYALQFFSYRAVSGGVPGTRLLTSRSAGNKANLLQFIRARADCDFVVDSSKHYLEALALYRAAPHDTMIIRLLRDGRAVFYSGLRRGMTPAAALAAWRNHWMRADAVFARQFPGRAVISVRYEDVASRPQQEIPRILREVGAVHPQSFDYASMHNRHIVNGNRMRFTANLAVSFDEKWRQGLSAGMLDYFERHAGELNRRLGYV